MEQVDVIYRRLQRSLSAITESEELCCVRQVLIPVKKLPLEALDHVQ
jgi:hypothetical protein